MSILDQIITRKKEEIAFNKGKITLNALMDSEFFAKETFSLKQSVESGNGIIAEFKRKSPSKGIINDRVTPIEVVSQYEVFGASGVSILTDTDFFGGSFEDLLSVRSSVNIPILRKDFMVDTFQFYEAKAMGADAVLLIAACLSPMQVQEFTQLAHMLQMEVLLEIHAEEELGHFNSAIDLVGINNRNLKDFKVDLQHSVNLKNLLPKGALSIAESGIYSVEDVKFLKEKGFDGFLMGEYFMKEESPGKAFEAFMQSAK